MFKFLDGYKMYIAGGVLAIVVAVEKFLGFDVPGIETPDNWFALLLTAFGWVGLKSALTKLEVK